MYRNIRSYDLRYTDVDAYDQLKLSSLLSLLEESACSSADELGFGYRELTPKHIGFILVNWYIELKRSINLGEKLTVHTWPLRPGRLIFLRDFELYVNEEKVGVATSRWCMVSTDTYTMLPTSVYFHDEDFADYNTERSVDFSAWKIASLQRGETIYSKIATYSDYDHYFHVNNTKYADLLMDVFSVEELRNKRISSVQITYVKQCKLEEKIDFIKGQDGEFVIVEGYVNGELRVQMRVRFDAI